MGRTNRQQRGGVKSTSWRLRRLGILSVALPALSCERSPTSPATVVIQTTQVQYELVPTGSRYMATVVVGLANAGTTPVYLHRFCGIAQDPAATVVRPIGSRVPVGFSGWGCDQDIPQLIAPILLAPGDSYSDEVDLVTATGGGSSDWTGPFRLEYVIQFSNRASEGGTDLLPREQRLSNIFVVALPE
jgi:hypothetical protein